MVLRPSARRPALPVLCAVGLLLALGACRGPRLVQGDGSSSGATPNPTPAGAVVVRACAIPVAGNAVAVVEPGVYVRDARFGALADAWPDQVTEAITLLDHRTGLGFGAGPPIRVVLEPLRDERLPYRIGIRVAEGRRQAVVTLNAEPLVAQRVRVDAALVRALAEAVFELVALRHEPVAPWVVSFAGTAAAGDLELQLARLQRDAVLGQPRAAEVDPSDAAFAFSTGLALFALLEDRDLMDGVPKLLAFAAQGDDPEWMLTRILRDPAAAWVGAARNALDARLRALDRSPWERLRDAELAWKSTGRGGLEAALEPPLPEAIEGEAKVLRMRAAMEAGDWAAARRLSAALTAAEERQLRDPAALLSLRAEIESRPDGDGEQAREWTRRLDLDFPKSEARAALRESYPLLGSGEDPLGWLTHIRAYIDRRGSDELDLRTIERVLRVLLIDHRAGAAARLVDDLGSRAEAPELEAVVLLVNDAQREPTPAAIEANRMRLEAWVASPSDDTDRDVRDGGRAAWEPALARLVDAADVRRRRLVQLLVALGGPSDTLRALAPAWRTFPERAGLDLDAIAERVDARVLRRVLGMLAPAILSTQAVDRLWFDASFGLEATWLDAHPRFLAQLRADTYMERRAAFDLAVAEGAVTPELVGRAARDPSALLRAEAVRTAGTEGFLALAAAGIRDASPIVRRAAARALADTNAAAAPAALLQLLRADPAPEVRIAAAETLLELRPRDPDVLDALVGTQANAGTALADAVGARLVEGAAAPVAFALVRAARVELRRVPPRGGVFARYVLLFQRVSGENLGFVPGLSKPEMSAIVERMRAWARRRAQRDASSSEGGGDGPLR